MFVSGYDSLKENSRDNEGAEKNNKAILQNIHKKSRLTEGKTCLSKLVWLKTGGTRDKRWSNIRNSSSFSFLPLSSLILLLHECIWCIFRSLNGEGLSSILFPSLGREPSFSLVSLSCFYDFLLCLCLFHSVILFALVPETSSFFFCSTLAFSHLEAKRQREGKTSFHQWKRYCWTTRLFSQVFICIQMSSSWSSSFILCFFTASLCFIVIPTAILCILQNS